MNGLLVDTNVISELLRPAPDAHVAEWSQGPARQTLFLERGVDGRASQGVTILPASARRTQLEKSIEAQVPHWFQGRILPVTQAIAERWGELDGIRQLAGRPLNAPDGMIAATALEHDLTVVTRNVKDFAGLGVALINPCLEQCWNNNGRPDPRPPMFPVALFAPTPKAAKRALEFSPPGSTTATRARRISNATFAAVVQLLRTDIWRIIIDKWRAPSLRPPQPRRSARSAKAYRPGS